jgi:hypothetical protein
MPIWKILLILVSGAACLGLGLATLIVPMTMVQDGSRWGWLAGLFIATVITAVLFRLFMNSADRAMKRMD